MQTMIIFSCKLQLLRPLRHYSHSRLGWWGITRRSETRKPTRKTSAILVLRCGWLGDCSPSRPVSSPWRFLQGSMSGGSLSSLGFTGSPWPFGSIDRRRILRDRTRGKDVQCRHGFHPHILLPQHEGRPHAISLSNFLHHHFHREHHHVRVLV